MKWLTDDEINKGWGGMAIPTELRRQAQEANRLREGLEDFINYLTYQPQGNALHIIDAKEVSDRIRELLDNE